MSRIDHIAGRTVHARKGAVSNRFEYGVDYVLLDPSDKRAGPSLFSRNRGNLASLWDRDHGGAVGQGSGVDWLQQVLAAHGITVFGRIALLAQPRILGHVFNPVSFWLVFDDLDQLCLVVAEVTNTFGDRHCYLCHHDDLSPIQPQDVIEARKVFHVSPFQPVEGTYRFRFDISNERINIRIDYSTEEGGLYATLTGPRVPLTNRSILRACLRRPFGSRRVLGLIHWQALKLWIKGAAYRVRPEPPRDEVSR